MAAAVAAAFEAAEEAEEFFHTDQDWKTFCGWIRRRRFLNFSFWWVGRGVEPRRCGLWN